MPDMRTDHGSYLLQSGHATDGAIVHDHAFVEKNNQSNMYHSFIKYPL